MNLNDIAAAVILHRPIIHPSQRTKIEPEEIRKGDLIRFEYADPSRDFSATEMLASVDAKPASVKRGQHYLLDRPAQSVELPTDPTLGWATWSNNPPLDGQPILAVWRLDGPVTYDGDLRQVDSAGRSSGGDPSKVAAFTPATAVPTDALDALRKQRSTWPLGISLNTDQLAIRSFLDAATEANK